MMTTSTTRRQIFGLGVLSAMLVGFSRKSAVAAANLSKSAVGYQDVPSAEGKVCAQCVYFIPIPAGASLGTCKLVTGGIAPGGWCEIWAPKT